MDTREGQMPEVEGRSSLPKLDADGAWRELCRRLNALRLEPQNWWARIAADLEAVFCVEESALKVRLRGNDFLEVTLRGTGLQCRIAPEHLLLSHPGARTVLGDVCAAAEPGRVASLADLAVHYDHVRRRVCAREDRRLAIADRLFLRHSCVLAVDADLPTGRADLVALSPQGVAVFFLLRRYQDPDLRLKGRGGVVWRMRELDKCLADSENMALWVRNLLERSRHLDTPHARRFRFDKTLLIHPRACLLVVDFDHAQRLHGLPLLRADLEAGLDHDAARGDIHCIGDAGNVSHGTFFSGI